ncbi:hypothetical protein GPECTOR_21g687 [Gonium pectorale]|uniref:Uncharacterized protein n=1 Tax=Gonium pectorale TaxID=33097 RepID=A0A150GHZ2_GONPE|nr:hypothetical protein GPECTOR_21g687 [Gonium pectorale]|eukprot:KXZ49461.1 hypothetical protein GPECTOR_21g687 [Gonium pectorale]
MAELMDIIVLCIQILVVPAVHLSRGLSLRAGCPSPDAAPRTQADGDPPQAESRPALFVDDYDQRLVAGFPCGSNAAGRAAYVLRSLYPFRLRTVALIDVSECVFMASMVLGLAALLTARALRRPGSLGPPHHQQALRHLVVAATRISMQLGQLPMVVLLWRRYGRDAAAMLLPLTSLKYFLADGRSQACLFAATMSVTVGKLASLCTGANAASSCGCGYCSSAANSLDGHAGSSPLLGDAASSCGGLSAGSSRVGAAAGLGATSSVASVGSTDGIEGSRVPAVGTDPVACAGAHGREARRLSSDPMRPVNPASHSAATFQVSLDDRLASQRPRVAASDSTAAAATGGGGGGSGVLYTSRLRSCVVSVKVRGHPSDEAFPEAAAAVAGAAGRALRAYNADALLAAAAAVRAAMPQRSAGGGGGGGSGAAAPGGPGGEARPPARRSGRSVMSSLNGGGVVVRGCVHLIQVMRVPSAPLRGGRGGGGGEGQQPGDGGSGLSPWEWQCLGNYISCGARIFGVGGSGADTASTGAPSISGEAPAGGAGLGNSSGDADAASGGVWKTGVDIILTPEAVALIAGLQQASYDGTATGGSRIGAWSGDRGDGASAAVSGGSDGVAGLRVRVVVAAAGGVGDGGGDGIATAADPLFDGVVCLQALSPTRPPQQQDEEQRAGLGAGGGGASTAQAVAAAGAQPATAAAAAADDGDASCERPAAVVQLVLRASPSCFGSCAVAYVHLLPPSDGDSDGGGEPLTETEAKGYRVSSSAPDYGHSSSGGGGAVPISAGAVVTECRRHRLLASLPLVFTTDPLVAAELNAAYDQHAAAILHIMVADHEEQHSLPYSLPRLAAYRDHMADLVADLAALAAGPPPPRLPYKADDGGDAAGPAGDGSGLRGASATFPASRPAAGAAAAAVADEAEEQVAVAEAVATGRQLLRYMVGCGMLASARLVVAELRQRWGMEVAGEEVLARAEEEAQASGHAAAAGGSGVGGGATFVVPEDGRGPGRASASELASGGVCPGEEEQAGAAIAAVTTAPVRGCDGVGRPSVAADQRRRFQMGRGRDALLWAVMLLMVAATACRTMPCAPLGAHGSPCLAGLTQAAAALAAAAGMAVLLGWRQ